MKIVFISGVKFGFDLLHDVLKSGWEVSAVFSYIPEKQKFYSDYTNFDQLSQKYDFIHKQVNNINDEENIQLIKSIEPDLILVMGWSQLLKKEIIELPKLGIIGSHPTELPKYRGRAPIPWTILKGLKKSALTFFFIEEGIDDGDILDQQFFEIIDKDDAQSLYEKMTSIGKTMLLKNLKLIEQGKINRIKQDPEKFIENWPKRTPEDGKINWLSSAESIHTLIRATTHPYPGAYTIFKTQKLIIWSASFIKNNNNNPGIILDVKKDSVVIGTGNGDLIVNNISINGNSEINLSNIFTLSDMGKTLGEK